MGRGEATSSVCVHLPLIPSLGISNWNAFPWIPASVCDRKAWIRGPSWAQLCLTACGPPVAQGSHECGPTQDRKCSRFFLLTISFWSPDFTGASVNVADGSPLQCQQVTWQVNGGCQGCATRSGTSYLRVAGTRLAA